jgi:tetratricopeptide (TPR) repeat protein
MRRYAPICLAWSLTLGCATSLDKARVAAEEGHYGDARELYEEALGDADTEADARNELAGLIAAKARKAEKADPAQAEASYREALGIAPAHDLSLTGLVRVLRRTDRLPEATEVIEAAAATGRCAACSRLGVVVRLERGDAQFDAGKWDEAIAHYRAALDLRPQPAAALAIVRAQLGAKRMPEALTALREAVPLMGDADASARAAFVAARQRLLVAVLAQDDVPTADEIAGLALANEGDEVDIAMRMTVGAHLEARGEVEVARTRYETLLAADGDEPRPDEAQRGVIGARLIALYRVRATDFLAAGKPDDADAAVLRAIELGADDWELKLQRVLSVAVKTGARPALASLEKVPPATGGVVQVRAILESLRVQELVAEGDLLAAREQLAAAQKTHPTMPEVHLAVAQVLAASEVEGLSRGQVATLRKTGIGYRGDVRRYAEALGELQWARTAASERKKDYPYRAPWFHASADALSRRIATAYAHTVEFREEPEPLLHLANSGDEAVVVKLDGPEGYREEVEIAAGEGEDVTLPDAGFVTLKIAGKKRSFVAEPYAKVTITL